MWSVPESWQMVNLLRKTIPRMPLPAKEDQSKTGISRNQVLFITATVDAAGDFRVEPGAIVNFPPIWIGHKFRYCHWELVANCL